MKEKPGTIQYARGKAISSNMLKRGQKYLRCIWQKTNFISDLDINNGTTSSFLVKFLQKVMQTYHKSYAANKRVSKGPTWLFNGSSYISTYYCIYT